MTPALYALSLVAVLTTAATPSPIGKVAPADRYFGSQKISALGIRNKTDALALRYHQRTITDSDLVHDAKLAESAAYDWQRRYPKDPWLPRTLYRLEQLFQAVQSTNARTHATQLANLIATAYPSTHEGHVIRLRLAQGFPALQAETATHATPNPYDHNAEPSPAPSVAPDAGSPSPNSAPISSPAATASPAPIPRAT